MKNNIINEVKHMKKLMLINEVSIIKWKFREGIKPKLNEKLNSLGDNDIKGFNLEVTKESPYRKGVLVTEKIDSKAKLFDELNSLDEIDIKNLTENQKNFLKELNSRLDDIDPKYIKELADSFKIDFKKSDDLAQKKFLSTFKELLKESEYVKFEKEIQGFTIKAGVFPILKDIIVGSKNTAVFLVKNYPLSTILVLVAGPTLIALLSLIKKGQKILIDKIEESSKTKGAKLFKLLLTEQNTFISGLSSEEISKAYGITEENKNEIDNYAQDFYNTKSWFDTTKGEVKDLFKNITSNFDGINIIYFLSKFQELSGQSLLKFLREQGIPNIDNIIFSEDSINPDFEFLTVMTSDVETSDSINTVMNAMTKSYGGEDGYSQMSIKQDSRNKNSEWIPFNNPDANIILNVINSNGETINFDYTTRIKILNDLKRYIDGVWSTAGSVKTIESAKNLFKQIWEDKKVPSNDDLLKLSLDPKTVYTEVSTKLMEEHPEFTKIMFTWPWVQKMNENVVGLAKILKEQPVLDNTKTKKKVNTNTTSGGVKTFPGPGTVQQFQDWLDSNYPTWLNGSKLNKGSGYGSYGPITQKAFTQYGSTYQNSLSSGGNTPTTTPQPVDKEKEIFDKFNDSFFFYSTNNQRFNVEYTTEIGKWIKYFNNKNFGQGASYLGAVLSVYGNMISKYKTDEQTQNAIDYYLPDLESYLKSLFEGIQLKKPVGLALILEQGIRPLVTVNVVNRIPQKQTESDNYKDASNKTIKSIIGGGDEIRKGEKGDTILTIKNELGYTKDKTPYFTEDFNTFVIDYKGKKGLANDNGNISQDLICSIDRYKNLCSSTTKQNTTAPVEQKKLPIEVKYLNDYATAVGTGTPSEGACKSLFDYYAQQAKDWDLGNKSGQPNTEITAELLKNAKVAVKRCKIGIKKNFYPRDQKYILDKNNPFYIAEFEKESKTPTTTQATKPTTPTVADNTEDDTDFSVKPPVYNIPAK